MSSAGLSRTLPPQTMQPPSRSTTRRMAVTSRSTGAIVSIASAVPAGEVIALDDVFGIVSPAAATMATTSGVVRFAGSPPTLCLSTMTGPGQDSRSPAASIASVSAAVSETSGLCAEKPVMNAASCTSE